MQPAPEPALAAPVFAALGDPTRLGLVATLADGRPRSVSELSEGRPISRQAVTKHLHVLEAAGVVGSLRAGRETRFALVPDRIASARDYLDSVGRQWEAALARLKDFVEAPRGQPPSR
jgi:DNA-binding transcriptional ArsR family regulator